MHANSSESRTYAHTKPSNPTWEAIKWLIAGGAILSIINTLWSISGGVV